MPPLFLVLCAAAGAQTPLRWLTPARPNSEFETTLVQIFNLTGKFQILKENIHQAIFCPGCSIPMIRAEKRRLPLSAR